MRRISLARQLLVLQLVVVAAAVAIAGGAAVWTAQDRATEQQRERVLSVAEALAASDDVRAALRRPRPSEALQPLAEAVRTRADLGFVVFMSPQGVRYSHPDPDRIGGRFVGTIAPARAGRAFTEETTGTLGPSVRSVVPIFDGGRVAGLVSVGVLKEAIADQAADQLPGLLLSLGVAIAVGAGLCLLLARRVRRQTRGMDPDELTALYEHHEAVLHSIREGVVVVDRDGRVRLANGEAQALLGLPEDAVGRPVAELVADPQLAAVLSGTAGEEGDVHVVGDRVLVSGQRRARLEGRHLGTVTTLRDRTEIEAVVRELGSVRGLADALRAQAHESANELHTVVGLVELGRYNDAIAFATRRIGVTQGEAEAVQERVGDPAVTALVLAKAAACRERGVHLVLDDASRLEGGAVPGEDLVTIVGNLVDNALDALAGQRGGRIELHLRQDADGVSVQVRDDGPGFPPDALECVFDAGWSTKAGDDARRRGLGLALVARTAERLGGTAKASNDGGAVVTVRLPVGSREAAAT